jgi:NADPH:quinone reductase-like Zn-dependent oxidoreductase
MYAPAQDGEDVALFASPFVPGNAGQYRQDEEGSPGRRPGGRWSAQPVPQTVGYCDGWAERVRGVVPWAVDYVLDTAGSGVLADSVALTGDPARVITIVYMTFAEHGARFSGMDPADRFPQALPLLADLAARGDLEVPVWRSYPLVEVVQAHAEIEAHRNNGKIILLP